MKFVKYDNFWWEYDTKTSKLHATLWNAFGGKTSDCNITKYEIVEANDFDCLDWNGTSLLDPNSKYGWLDREGNFYGCGYRDHRLQAEFVHKKSQIELEKLGWIHISRKRDDNNDFMIYASFFGDFRNGVVPTIEQLKYITSHPEIQIDLSLDRAINNGNYQKAKMYEEKKKNETENTIEDDKEL